jgi:hypothetical protein
MSVPWSSTVFAQYLKENGCSIPSGCIEIKLICKVDVCRICFKIQSIEDSCAKWVTRDVIEEFSTGMKKVISDRYENCYSYIVSAVVDGIVSVEVLQHGGLFDANLISNL